MNVKILMWVNILLIIFVAVGTIIFIDKAEKKYNNNNTTHYPYEIVHYTDTINENIILTTVCYYENKGYISVSTLKLN